jgi:hypothetical protein
LDKDKVTDYCKKAWAAWDPDKNKKFNATEAPDVRQMRKVMVAL